MLKCLGILFRKTFFKKYGGFGFMKSYKFLAFIFLFFFVNTSFAYDSGHVYINGIINSINASNITISHSTYRIDKKCKIIILYKENNSFHEKQGRFSNINIGDSVTAKMIGGILYEIIIEEWKK